MPRLSLLLRVFLSASLLFSASCKPKASEEESSSEEANIDAPDADVAADTDTDDASDDEPVIQLGAPDNALLGGQGLKNPQEDSKDTEDSGLKLQLGGGSGYGYQRNQPSLLND